MKTWDNGILRDMTAEEISAMKLAAIEANRRPITEAEVSRMLIAQQINTLDVDDNTALRMREFYPQWAENTAYAVGFKVQRKGKLWKARQAHTSTVTWEPENTMSLWEVINEIHDGSIDDPIPYDGNMALENGKHYIQSSVIYLCTRDTINPVYSSLAELVGIYVVVA